jgi:Uma2 family endonuclease
MPKITSLDQLDMNKTYSYADYLTWQFKERVELIKGKIFKMSPAPNRQHQSISSNLHGFFWSYFRKHSCQVFAAPFDVRLPVHNNNEQQYTVVQPDLCVICDEHKLDKQGCVGAPDLIIEILSPGNTKHEMDQKFDLYQEAGVKEYWLVEPKDKVVFVYTLNEQGQYIGLKPFTEDASISPVIFPDLAIDLEEVFAD